VACTLLAAAVLLGGKAAAQQTEEVLSYDVLVDVRPGGQLLVTEEITVRALGQEIRRGIYRDLPTSFPRGHGLGRIEAPFEVRAVLRDGTPEPYAVLSIGNGIGRGGVRIRAGRENVLLEPGVYTYSFEYVTDRWVVFGDGTDQLYWNVTGNGWSFPIRAATARIRISELGVEPALEAWTGPDGSTESEAELAWDAAEREASFRTTRSLGPQEGLTVRVSFPSGHLSPPGDELKAEWFRLDWGGYIDAAYLVLLVASVYLLMWRRVGIDPAPGPVTLRSEPPAGFSPAALAYLEERGYEKSHLAAALVSMAMKGAIRIEHTGGTWTLHKVRDDASLAPEEARVFQELLGDSESIVLERENHARLRKAIQGLRRTLSRQLERAYFENNRGWFFLGLAVSIAGLAALTWRWRFGIEPTAWFLGLWLTGWTAGVATMVTRIVQMARRARSVPLAGAGAVVLSVFALPFVAAELVVAGILSTTAPTHLLLACLLVAGTNVLFYHLLERPTLRGRGVLNELEGFKAYLAGARHAPSARSGGIDHFERHLPHAIALGLEDRWAEGFGAALDPSRQRGGTDPTWPWYDHDHGALDARTFASTLGSGLANTFSSASSPPSSGGGGGGGGGSSGGGGGGGGGGGW